MILKQTRIKQIKTTFQLEYAVQELYDYALQYAKLVSDK
jgi:hypothetical protein